MGFALDVAFQSLKQRKKQSFECETEEIHSFEYFLPCRHTTKRKGVMLSTRLINCTQMDRPSNGIKHKLLHGTSLRNKFTVSVPISRLRSVHHLPRLLQTSGRQNKRMPSNMSLYEGRYLQRYQTWDSLRHSPQPSLSPPFNVPSAPPFASNSTCRLNSHVQPHRYPSDSHEMPSPQSPFTGRVGDNLVINAQERHADQRFPLRKVNSRNHWLKITSRKVAR